MARKELTVEERKLTVDLHLKKDKSYSEISEIISQSPSAIQKVINWYKEKSIENKIRNGRLKKLSVRDVRAIKILNF